MIPSESRKVEDPFMVQYQETYDFHPIHSILFSTQERAIIVSRGPISSHNKQRDSTGKPNVIHSIMNKKLAFENRLCYEREVVRKKALHEHKLQTVLPTCLSPSKRTLDSTPPVVQPHLRTNAKRHQTEMERQMDIYTANQKLAIKMDRIRHRQENKVLAASSIRTDYNGIDSGASPRLNVHPPPTPKKSIHSPARVHMPGIRLDATQTPIVDCYLSPELSMGRGNACVKPSLVNKFVQKRQQNLIAEENRRMKQRVQAQKPFYNTRQWDTEWQGRAARFQHVQQNGTIGYLLPPKTANPKGCSGHRQAVTRPYTDHLRERTVERLPSLNGGIKDTKSDYQAMETEYCDNHSSGDVVEDESFELGEPLQCFSCLLLEATTSKGVELQVHELQILGNRCFDAEITEEGDRGLIVKGRYLLDIEGEYHVTLEMLRLLAQEIDDLELMIKLETINQIPFVGNFPRLSALLDDDELQKLLFRLVQRTHIEIHEAQRLIYLSSKVMKTPRRVGSHDDRAWLRPRTCPSTISSGDFGTNVIPRPVDSDPIWNAAHADNVRLRFANLISQHAKYGSKKGEGFFLIRLRFDQETTVLSSEMTCISATGDSTATLSSMDFQTSELVGLLKCLDDKQVAVEDLISSYRRMLLRASLKSDSAANF